MEHEENVGSAVSMKVVDNTDVQQSMTTISHASTNTPTERGGDGRGVGHSMMARVVPFLMNHTSDQRSHETVNHSMKFCLIVESCYCLIEWLYLKLA